MLRKRGGSTEDDDLVRKLPATRRRRIEARAKQLIAEELTRQQLRVALQRTQVEVAKALGINQDSVSRLEQGTDILLSTLRKYIEALGGHLSIVAEFPDHVPVRLPRIADEKAQRPVRKPRRKSARVFA